MGARFEALDEGILAAALKSTGYFFAISISQKVRCIERVYDFTSFGANNLINFKQIVKHVFFSLIPN